MLEEEAESLCVHGCPVGTLSSELGKLDRREQARTRRIFDQLLEWLTQRLEDIPATRRGARQRAEQLLVMAQGAALVGHAYRDPELIRRQAALIRDWVRSCAATRRPKAS
jgi:TetR/AcrR family transcriptional regulator, transcriptional repressor for nem operon